MKILVREAANGICNYVWKSVKTNRPICNVSYITTDGHSYPPIEVIKITHDFRRTGYIICSECGEVVKRDKILKHYEAQERNANCVKCDWLRLVGDKKETNKMSKDGLCIQTIKATPACSCGSWYRPTKLAELDKPAKCKFFACRRSEAVEIQGDFFSKYNNPFKDLLTENVVISKGWKFLHTTLTGREYTNKNGKVTAVFDTNGILKYFEVICRSSTYKFVYSDVYDTFMTYTGKEDATLSSTGLSDKTRERYIKQIKALYK